MHFFVDYTIFFTKLQLFPQLFLCILCILKKLLNVVFRHLLNISWIVGYPYAEQVIRLFLCCFQSLLNRDISPDMFSQSLTHDLLNLLYRNNQAILSIRTVSVFCILKALPQCWPARDTASEAHCCGYRCHNCWRTIQYSQIQIRITVAQPGKIGRQILCVRKRIQSQIPSYTGRCFSRNHTGSDPTGYILFHPPVYSMGKLWICDQHSCPACTEIIYCLSDRSVHIFLRYIIQRMENTLKSHSVLLRMKGWPMIIIPQLSAAGPEPDQDLRCQFFIDRSRKRSSVFCRWRRILLPCKKGSHIIKFLPCSRCPKWYQTPFLVFSLEAPCFQTGLFL